MDKDTIGVGCAVLFIVVIILLVGGGLWLGYRAPETVEGVVVDTYIKRYSDDDYFHVVVQYDDGTEEVFQNRDAFWIGKWNSADLQLVFEIGERYHFDVRGTRWPFMSEFRNITEATLIPSE